MRWGLLCTLDCIHTASHLNCETCYTSGLEVGDSRGQVLLARCCEETRWSGCLIPSPSSQLYVGCVLMTEMSDSHNHASQRTDLPSRWCNILGHMPNSYKSLHCAWCMNSSQNWIFDLIYCSLHLSNFPFPLWYTGLVLSKSRVKLSSCLLILHIVYFIVQCFESGPRSRANAPPNLFHVQQSQPTIYH